MQDPKGGGQSYLVAHDKVTGEEKWVTKQDTGSPRSRPILTPPHFFTIGTAIRK